MNKASRLISKAAEGLFPGYFAFVMATGIVGVAMRLVGMHRIAEVFFWIAVLGQSWLLFLTAVRANKYPQKLWNDFRTFARAPGFFTMIAAFGVLGSFAVRQSGNFGFAYICWAVGAALWLVMIYAFMLCMMTAREKPAPENAVNGGWLILVVATQSLSVLGSLLSAAGKDWLLFLSACFFMLGCALYALLITFLALRLVFRVIEPAAMVPLYWIMMGAAAITTLAGVELNRQSEFWSVQVQALPLLQGFIFFFWVIATAWIPLLVMLGIWRHLVRGHSFRYEPQLWSVVFPLGMYSVATHGFADEFSLGFLKSVPNVFAVIALLAWCAAFIGMTLDIGSGSRPHAPSN